MATRESARPQGAHHAHNVFFTLHDSSPQQRSRLVSDCYEFLKGHDGVVALSAGTRAEDCERDVNDLQFHVSLHMVFRDRASHDAYQEAPRHMQFVERNRANWKAVRVFDSDISAGGVNGK